MDKKRKTLLITVAAVLLVVAAFLLLRRSQPLGELIPAPETPVSTDSSAFRPLFPRRTATARSTPATAG